VLIPGAALVAAFVVPGPAWAVDVVEGEVAEFPAPAVAQPGTATEDDFRAEGGVTGPLRVTAIQDAADEATETFDVNGQTHRILDDDVTPRAQDVRVAEAAGTAVVVVTTADASPRATTFPVAVQGGGGDIGAVPGQLTLPAGATRAELAIPIAGDAEDEDDESFTVTVGSARATVTIADDDERLLGVVDAGTVAEGGLARFLVRLDMPATRPVTVAYATTDGGATAPADYLARLGTLTFAPGQLAQEVAVPTVGDRASEGPEGFALRLTGATGARVVRDTATAAIRDDDVPGAGTAAAEGDDRAPRMGFGPLRRGRGGRIRARVTCPGTERSCEVRFTVYASRDRRVRALRRERRLGSVIVTLRGGRARTLTVRAPRALRQALARASRGRAVRLRAYLVAEDAAGNVSTRSQTARLRFG